MFLDLKKELVEKRLSVRAKIEKHKEAIAGLNNKIEKIQEDSKKDMLEFADLNQEINDQILPQCIDKLKDYEVPDEVVLEDGKPFLKVIDLRKDAVKQALEMKKNWKDYILKRKEENKK